MDLHDNTIDAMKNKGVSLEEDGVLGALAVEFEQVEMGDVIGGEGVGEGKGAYGGRAGGVVERGGG